MDLAAPDGSAEWWYRDGWVHHALTNEEALFHLIAEPVVRELAALRMSLAG